MNLFDLEIFKTIYEIKSLNKAATLLGYSQSNISARLKIIEAEFNRPLFIRSHQGVKATIEGEKVYQFVSKTLSEMNHLKESFSDELPQLLISELLFNFLVIEKEEFSLEQINITIKKTNEIERELDKHFYHQVITFSQLNNHPNALKKVDELDVCFLQSQISSQKAPIIFINSDTSCPLRQLTLSLIPASTKLIEVDSLESILNLVAKGQGISLLPQYFIKRDAYRAMDKKTYQIKYYTYRF